MKSLALIWHIHQPAFVPDSEVLEQVEASYRPLLAAHEERALPLSLNVCGGLLDRLLKLAPDFVETLRRGRRAGWLEPLASGLWHPMLPLLPIDRARRQIEDDVFTKEEVFGVAPKGFWPTDLGWAPHLAVLLAAEGIEWVAVNSSSFVEGSVLPSWREERRGGHRVLAPELAPLVSARELGRAARVRVGEASVLALPRHHALSWDLVDREAGALHHPEALPALHAAIGAHFDSGAELLVIGDDGERVRPETLRNYHAFLDGLPGDVALTTGGALAARQAGAPERYLPAGTALVDFSAWEASPDDRVCRQLLAEVQARFAEAERRLGASDESGPGDELSAIDVDLLECEDAAFTFWKYLRRTREPYLAKLYAIRAALDALG